MTFTVGDVEALVVYSSDLFTLMDTELFGRILKFINCLSLLIFGRRNGEPHQKVFDNKQIYF